METSQVEHVTRHRQQKQDHTTIPVTQEEHQNKSTGCKNQHVDKSKMIHKGINKFEDLKKKEEGVVEGDYKHNQQRIGSPTASTVSTSPLAQTAMNSPIFGSAEILPVVNCVRQINVGDDITCSQCLPNHHNMEDFHADETFAEIIDTSGDNFVDGSPAHYSNSNTPLKKSLLSRSMSMPLIKMEKRPNSLLRKISADVDVQDPIDLCYDDITHGNKKLKKIDEENEDMMEIKSSINPHGCANFYSKDETKILNHYMSDFKSMSNSELKINNPIIESPSESLVSFGENESNVITAEEKKSFESNRITELDIVNSLISAKSNKIKGRNQHTSDNNRYKTQNLECIDEYSCSSNNINDNNTIKSSCDETFGHQTVKYQSIEEFVGHPYFPLLRDLTTASVHFGSPSLPGEMLFNLPTDINMLLYNFCSRNKLSYPSFTADRHKDERIYLALSTTHQSLIQKIESRKQRQSYLMRSYSTSNIQNKFNDQQMPSFIPSNQKNDFYMQSPPRTPSSIPQPVFCNENINNMYYGSPQSRINSPANYQGYLPQGKTFSPLSGVMPSQSGFLPPMMSPCFPMNKKNSFPKEASEILLNWLQQNQTHPYPSDLEKDDLRKKTGLTMVQVNNWFTNARRRILKRWKESDSSLTPDSSKSLTNTTPNSKHYSPRGRTPTKNR